jgi:hypothetical protein
MPRGMCDTSLLRKKCEKDVWPFPFVMDLRSIILSLQLKGMNGREISDDLVATLPNDAPGYSTVTRWLRQGEAVSFLRTGSRFD